MKKHFLFILMLLAGSRVYAATAKEYCDAGLRLYASNNYQQAIQYFDAAIKMEPSNAQALLGRANCFNSMKKYHYALSDYQKVQALQPQDTQVKQFVKELQTKIDESPREITWRKPSEGLAESIRTQKPILYDMTAEWCGYCRRLKKNVFDNPDCAARINLLFVPVQVMDRYREVGQNSREVIDIQNKYKVKGFPTLVVQYPGRSDFKMIVGFGDAKRIMSFLNRAVQ